MADGPKIRNTQRNLALSCDVRAVADMDRTLTFIASTEAVASDGDLVKVDGWDLETRFQQNPVFLWCHDSWSTPIGRAVAWRKVTDDGEPRLEIDIQFAGPEQGDEFADRVYLLYLTGFLRACSVGFWIRAYEKPDDETKAELGLGPWGVIVTKAELIELSAVTVGADPNALITDGAVEQSLSDALVACRSAAGLEDQGRIDKLIRQLPGEWSVTDEDPEVVPAESRTDPLSLDGIRTVVREELRAAMRDLRAGEPVADESPEGSPDGSERDPDDFFGLNDQLKELLP